MMELNLSFPDMNLSVEIKATAVPRSVPIHEVPAYLSAQTVLAITEMLNDPTSPVCLPSAKRKCRTKPRTH
jgi:hypothetical protein